MSAALIGFAVEVFAAEREVLIGLAVAEFFVVEEPQELGLLVALGFEEVVAVFGLDEVPQVDVLGFDEVVVRDGLDREVVERLELLREVLAADASYVPQTHDKTNNTSSSFIKHCFLMTLLPPVLRMCAEGNPSVGILHKQHLKSK